MYFMPKYRYNPESGREEDYLTLKESFRDKAGRVRTRTLLTVTSVPRVLAVSRRKISLSSFCTSRLIFCCLVVSIIFLIVILFCRCKGTTFSRISRTSGPSRYSR